MELKLLTVYETAYLLDMSPRQIYGALACGYLSGCKITGPTVHASWRIAVESARRFYDRIYDTGGSGSSHASGNTWPGGFEERLADLKEFLIQHSEGSQCLEGRGWRVERAEGGSNKLRGEEHRGWVQLSLFDNIEGD